jgi:glycosyltransferase involved in cell wall biosynthesis
LIYNGRFPYENGINADVKLEFAKYKKTEKTKILLNVASLSPAKNQTMLCDAVNYLVKNGYDVVLLIMGRKVSQSFYEKILERKTDKIYLLGEKHNPRDYMAESDIFCLGSTVEGMPISLIEAFSTGIIPVCTPVGGIVNMIQDGINGFLSNEVTEESYIEALKKALDLNENDMMEMKRQSLLSFSRYSMEKCANSYLDLMFPENE